MLRRSCLVAGAELLLWCGDGGWCAGGQWARLSEGDGDEWRLWMADGLGLKPRRMEWTPVRNRTGGKKKAALGQPSLYVGSAERLSTFAVGGIVEDFECAGVTQLLFDVGDEAHLCVLIGFD